MNVNAEMDFPRLLIASDVPVTDTVGGSLQLFRLFEGYPAARLCVCEGSLGAGHAVRSRLPGVPYTRHHSGSARWRRSRLVALQGALLVVAASAQAGRIAAALSGFRPEAVLTVAQDFACLGAAAFARRARLPLHLVVHDDWVSFARLPRWFLPFARRRFECLYRQAAVRWCISPAMEEFYRDRHGVAGRVLLPVRGSRDEPSLSPRLDGARPGPFIVAYAGTVTSGGRAKLLLELAAALAADGHRFDLFVPGGAAILRAQAAKVGCLLDPPNLGDRGYVEPANIVRALRDGADALLVAETFDPLHHDAVAYNFPSKLADYTAAGLPILVWAPPWASASRWARENPAAAALVDSEDASKVHQVVRQLAAGPALRRRMAGAALAAGREQFDPAAARGRLHRAIADSVRAGIGV